MGTVPAGPDEVGFSVSCMSFHSALTSTSPRGNAVSHVKGSNLLNRHAFVQDNFGPDAWVRILARLPDADTRLLTPRLLASSWYPFDLYNRLDEAMCQVLAGGDLKLCRTLGEDSARRALSGTYRLYLKDGAEAILRRLAVLHGSFYDAGSMEVSHLGQGHCAIRTVYVPRSSATNCLVASGFYRTVVEICGGRQVQVSEANCSANGAPFCLFNVRWEDTVSAQPPA